MSTIAAGVAGATSKAASKSAGAAGTEAASPKVSTVLGASRIMGPAVLLALSARAAFPTALKNGRQGGGAERAAPVPAEVTKLKETLKQARQENVNNRKAQAAQKLSMIKAKIQMLKAMGGDPKVIAKLAKQLAQELKAAASEFKSALQAGGGADPTAASGDAQPVPAEGGPAATEAATAVGATMVGTPGTSGAKPGQGESEEETTAPDAMPQTEEGKRQQIATAYQDAAGSMREKMDRARGDRDMLREFGDTALELKRLLQSAAKKIKEQEPASNAAREANGDVADLDREISDLAHAVRDSMAPTGEGLGALAGISGPMAVDILG